MVEEATNAAAPPALEPTPLREVGMLGALWEKLTAEGGLFRVRSVLALGLTGIGGAYLLLHQEMPPAEYNSIWLAATGWYFISRSRTS